MFHYVSPGSSQLLGLPILSPQGPPCPSLGLPKRLQSRQLSLCLPRHPLVGLLPLGRPTGWWVFSRWVAPLVGGAIWRERGGETYLELGKTQLLEHDGVRSRTIHVIKNNQVSMIIHVRLTLPGFQANDRKYTRSLESAGKIDSYIATDAGLETAPR